MRAEVIRPYLRPFMGRQQVLIHDQSVGDIIQGILVNHDRYKPEYDKIADFFKGANHYETGHNIWQFLKDNVRYRVEPDSRQMLKSPAAIIAPGTSSDCKNYSLFTGGILDALNRQGQRIPWVYRFSSYRLLDRVPQHVFVVMYPGTKREIWIDAVLPHYNQHKQYYYKVDKKVKSMSLIALAGIDELAGIGKKGDKRRKFFQKLLADIKKAGKFVIKISLPGPRNAALELIKLNFRSIATNLLPKIQTEPDKVKNFWESIGGNYNALVKATEKGAKHKRLGYVEDVSAIGVIDPATQAALITAGTTVLVAMITKLGIKGKDADDLNKDKTDADKKLLDDITREAGGEETATGTNLLRAAGGNLKTIAIVGGAALVGYMLLKKKK